MVIIPGKCKEPDFEVFDWDVYECPCGHLYGHHDYHCTSRVPGHLGRMVIERCLKCDPQVAD